MQRQWGMRILFSGCAAESEVAPKNSGVVIVVVILVVHFFGHLRRGNPLSLPIQTKLEKIPNATCCCTDGSMAWTLLSALVFFFCIFLFSFTLVLSTHVEPPPSSHPKPKLKKNPKRYTLRGLDAARRPYSCFHFLSLDSPSLQVRTWMLGHLILAFVSITVRA